MTGEFLGTIAQIVGEHLKTHYTEEEYQNIEKEIRNLIRIEDSQEKEDGYTYQEVDRLLSGINEKQKSRKERGVYYTPEDVVRFILKHSTLCYFEGSDFETSHKKILDETKKKAFAFQKTVFDPTCGSGEFLVPALKLKFEYAGKAYEEMDRGEIFEIVKTVYGNDINEESVAILKLRIFLFLLERFGIEKIQGISQCFKYQFWTYDYLQEYRMISEKFDLIIGNPPYVEERKSQVQVEKSYGNIYANVLMNSVEHLEKEGVMGYIIPLSYVSTPRMRMLRHDFMEKMREQWLFSFADRPDCLFTSVHQKLTILIAKKSKNPVPKIWTSNYQYWYKAQRASLFEGLAVFRNQYVQENFIPKIGNSIEESIYQKVGGQKHSFLELIKKDGEYKVYVNQRATFWMKAFLGRHEGGDYKAYGFEEESIRMYASCLFNSTLFWWFWVCVSDCWHLTMKELRAFRVPEPLEQEKAKELAIRLEKRLEETKKYIGSKQTAYEYKHKECQKEIKEIDEFIGEIFGLTAEESEYLSGFAKIYRISKGADNETD